MHDSLKILKKELSSFSRRKKLIFGEGPPRALLCIVGESPGKEEEKQGRPFVGKSGKILNQLLLSVGWERNTIYITNLIKTPVDKHSFSAKNLHFWTSYLLREIACIQPKIILSLGRLSSRALLQAQGLPFTSMKKLQGKHFSLFISNKKLLLIPLYHPAAAGRSSTIFLLLQKEFKKIQKFLQ